MKNETAEKLTALVLEAMESGAKRQAMRNTKGQRNAISGKPYNGLNGITTKRQAFAKWFTDARRATFKQAKAVGGTIRKGEKGTPIYFYAPKEKLNAKGEKEEYRILKLYYVRNLEQIEGGERKEEATYNHETINEAEAIVEQYTAREGIRTKHGEPAYSPTFDLLYMPQLCEFKTPEQYYLAYYHEMAHSTGHSKRLKRLETNDTLGNREEYSKEELVAEFGACLIYATTGKDFDLLNSATYLANRAKHIKTNNKQAELIQAIGKAEKAKNYILNINY